MYHYCNCQRRVVTLGIAIKQLTDTENEAKNIKSDKVIRAIEKN